MSTPPFDPRSAPVVGRDGHLPRLPEALLQADALALRLAGLGAWQPRRRGDSAAADGRPTPSARAAVLLALMQREAGLSLLLTRRADHLRHHAGQVSLPGGRSEASDADAAATALRESWEEVGLAPQGLRVIGQMPVYTTVTNFIVTPVVAHVPQPPALPSLVVDPREVAAVFEVPLARLLDPARHRRHAVVFDGRQREFLSIAWSTEDPQADDTEADAPFIWGATAAMLRNFYDFLAAGEYPASNP